MWNLALDRERTTHTTLFINSDSFSRISKNGGLSTDPYFISKGWSWEDNGLDNEEKDAYREEFVFQGKWVRIVIYPNLHA